MKEDRLRFLEALFDDGDQIAFGKDNASSNKPLDPIPFFLFTDAEKFCINPLKEWRITENVTKIQSLLFEWDDAEVSPKEQVKRFINSGIPFTTMVYSGGKSIHVIVRFTEPIENKEWQESWWDAIAKGLEKFGIIADVRARLVVQLSRVPESTRENTGEVQSLITIRNRVSFLEMTEWLQANGVQVEPPKPYVPYVWDSSKDRGDVLTRWNRAVRWTEKHKGVYSKYMTTGLHDWLFTYGGNCFKNEVDLDTAIHLAVTEWGTHFTGTSGTGPVEKSVRLGWKWMEKRN